MREALDYTCQVCGFALWRPLVRLRVSVLGLYDDARFPGRCLLALDEHHDDVVQLAADVVAAWFQDARDAAEAITHVSRADRINYAVLGNVEPHVHMHLVPRRWATDPAPGRAPWQARSPATPLAKEVRSTIERGLVDFLRSSAATR